MKKSLSYIISGMLLIVILLMAIKKQPVIVPTKTILTTLVDNKLNKSDSLLKVNNNLSHKLDSFKAVEPIIIVKYRTLYDSLLITDSNCTKSLTVLNKECEDLTKFYKNINANQEEQLYNYTEVVEQLHDVIDIKSFQMYQDSLIIVEQNKNLTQLKRKNKLQKVGSIIIVGLLGTAYFIK